MKSTNYEATNYVSSFILLLLPLYLIQNNLLSTLRSHIVITICLRRFKTIVRSLSALNAEWNHNIAPARSQLFRTTQVSVKLPNDRGGMSSNCSSVLLNLR
jgi:hypothetical protein